MTIEEAICFHQNSIFDASQAIEIEPDISEIANRVIDASDLAIEALKEKAEREKGCSVCHPNNRDYHFNGKLPNFCPYCGKQLKEVQP